MYPRCAPRSDNVYLQGLQDFVPRIKEGKGRSFEMQALYQFIGLVIALAIALIAGAVTGAYR